jgi:RNA polymerase sigma factor (sigma-70 family)
MTLSEEAPSPTGEPMLLRRLREGDNEAFGELFEAHVAAVRRLAGSLANDSSEADDITAETFFRVLQALRRGAGPTDNVRAYLLTVARRVSWEWHGSRRDVPVSADELNWRAGVGGDTQVRSAESSLITRAFSTLPERWRTVLWQTEVEGEQPAVVAPHYGLSANATAALARRARQGLRAAYLQAHLSVQRSEDGCRAVMEKLGGFTAGSVTGVEARRIRLHLRTCASCSSTHAELREVCSTLRAHAGAVVLLVPAAGLAFGTSSAALSTGAAATASTAGGAAVSGAAAAAGSQVKVGVALASTVAAGAFGVVVGPVVDPSLEGEYIGLPGRATVELQIAEPTPQTSVIDGTPWTVPQPPPTESPVIVPEPAGEYRVPRRPEHDETPAATADPADPAEPGTEQRKVSPAGQEMPARTDPPGPQSRIDLESSEQEAATTEVGSTLSNPRSDDLGGSSSASAEESASSGSESSTSESAGEGTSEEADEDREHDGGRGLLSWLLGGGSSG